MKFLPKRIVNPHFSKLNRPLTSITQKNKLKEEEIKSVNLDLNLCKIDSNNRIDKILEDERKMLQPYIIKNKNIKFQKQPNNKIEKGQLLYNDIFIKPKLNKLDELKIQGNNFKDLVYNGINQQYDSILGSNAMDGGDNIGRFAMNEEMEYDMMDFEEEEESRGSKQRMAMPARGRGGGYKNKSKRDEKKKCFIKVIQKILLFLFLSRSLYNFLFVIFLILLGSP